MLACFAPVLFADRQFAFRDAGDFYYPLYLRVQQEWRAGRLPLWEPEENGGVPLLGYPSAAVLYPGKLIYAALSYPWAARIYIIAHVALAFSAMWIMMRGWKVSASGTALAALGYAFGGPVLLQYCNVIFLVGAAWMPLAFYFADLWLRLGKRRALVWMAVILSMQILGGDPQAAYLAVGCAGAYAVGLSLTSDASRRGRRVALAGLAIVAAYVVLLAWTFWGEEFGRRMRIAWWPSAARLALAGWIVTGVAILIRELRRKGRGALEAHLVGLGLCTALAMSLAGVQLVPCLEFVSRSPRMSALQTPASIYDHSIHPARAVEALWPSFFGTIDRGNHRWLQALPPTFDHQVWTESLYLGGFTIYLGLAAAGLRKGPSWRGWLTIVVFAGLACALGSYGSPLFWARSVAALEPFVGSHVSLSEGWPDASLMPDGVGGPYWFLTVALPGFSAFRFPGKLLVVASLGLSGLAGLGWDDLCSRGSRRAVSLALVGMSASALGLILLTVPASRAMLFRFLESHPELTTSVFGPLDTAGAVGDALRALGQGAVVSALVLAVSLLARRRPGLAACLAVSATTIDLYLAHASLLYTIPQRFFDAKPRALQLIERAEANEPSPGPFRIHRQANWAPAAWLNRGSPHRLEDIARWERDSLRSKYPITEGVACAYTHGTAELSNVTPFFQATRIQLDPATCRRNGFPEGYQVVYFMRRGFDLWNTRYFILPARLAFGSRFRGVLSLLPRTTEIDPPPGAFDGPDGERLRASWLRDDDVQILRNEASLPRAWIVHRARFPAPIASHDTTGRQRLMDEMLYQDDELWHVEGRKVHDPGDLAWIEVDPALRPSVARSLSGAERDPSETVSIDRYDPDRVELTARLNSPGLVVLADVDYPGWELTIDGRPTQILRTNRAMRGALVSAGTHRLVYSYRPACVVVGAALSALGLGVLVYYVLRG
jgi:hypothetical protein